MKDFYVISPRASQRLDLAKLWFAFGGVYPFLPGWGQYGRRQRDL